MPKNTRAIKATDSAKAWNKKPKPSSYKIGTIPINKTILIICEGQTEKLYFDSFPVYGIKVEVIDSKGESKIKLVESAQVFIKKAGIKYDEIWCVFDMDIRRGEREFADFDNAIHKAISLKYKVAYSNDSFELWFYLHYNSTESQNIRTFYYEELSRIWGFNYVKEGKKFDFCLKVYGKLLQDINSSQQRAIKRAQELYNNQRDLPFHQQNPVTKVFELVEELNKNLRR